MMDRTTKLLLGVIAVALWAIAVRPMLPARDAQAQASPPPAAEKKVKATYEFLESEQGGTTGIYQLKEKLDGMASKGWRVKSVDVTDNATVILMEKTD
jgi:hypothetical protein